MNNQQEHRRPMGPNPGQQRQGQKRGPKFSLSWVYAIIAIALMYMWIQGGEPNEGGITRNISYSEFKDYVSKGYAEKVVAYDDNKVELTIIPDSAARIFGEGAVKEGQPVVLLHQAAPRVQLFFLYFRKKPGHDAAFSFTLYIAAFCGDNVGVSAFHRTPGCSGGGAKMQRATLPPQAEVVR